MKSFSVRVQSVNLIVDGTFAVFVRAKFASLQEARIWAMKLPGHLLGSYSMSIEDDDGKFHVENFQVRM